MNEEKRWCGEDGEDRRRDAVGRPKATDLGKWAKKKGRKRRADYYSENETEKSAADHRTWKLITQLEEAKDGE